MRVVIFCVFFALITSDIIAQKVISGKNEKVFSLKLKEFIAKFDEAHPAALVDNILSYEKYLKIVERHVKDPNDKIYKKVKRISSEDFEAYQIGSLSQIKMKFLEEGLKFNRISNLYLEEEKKYKDGWLRRGEIHFTVDGRKIRIDISYLKHKRKFYLLGLDKVRVQYKKSYVEPITFVSNFWDSLPLQLPNDRVFFYPKMKSFETPQGENNTIIINGNSPEIDSILHRSKNVGSSATYEMIDLKKDTTVAYKLYMLHKEDTLYAASLQYLLNSYSIENNMTWIPTKLIYQELANDSVHYQVSSIPRCQMRGSDLFFDFYITIRFGRYSRAINVHNGATTYSMLEINFSTYLEKLKIEIKKEETDDFSKKILKTIFQVEEEVIFQVINSKGEVVE
ncbi:hypothetical protein WAF17_15665 [Bernardetia sp. ABR2-2B]|uniref:hypothetical protein n=1 Tax=Bernardetia sp. ABR2-2B TaxID=3127472 RepID=UPI0030D02E45